MKIEVEVTAQMIADQMTAAFEGGSSYWCYRAVLMEPSIEACSQQPWYCSPELYAEDSKLRIQVINDEDVVYHFGVAEIKVALEKIAAKWPWHLKAILARDGDAETGDVLLQVTALGTIVYG